MEYYTDTQRSKETSETKNNMNELQSHVGAYKKKEYTQRTFTQNSAKRKLQWQKAGQQLSGKRCELPRSPRKLGKDKNARLLSRDGFMGTRMLKLLKLHTWNEHSLFFVGYYLFYTNGLNTPIISQRFSN